MRSKWRTAAPRWLYFFSFVWLATFGRFTSVLLEELGLTAAQLGVVIAGSRLLSLFTSPLLAWISDAIRDPWLVGLICAVSQCSFSLLIFAVGIFIPATGSGATAATIRTASASLCVVLGLVSVSGFFPILDALTVEAVGTAGYADERVWGAMSWGVAHLALGAIADWSGSTLNIALVNPVGTALFLFFYCRFRREQRVEGKRKGKGVTRRDGRIRLGSKDHGSSSGDEEDAVREGTAGTAPAAGADDAIVVVELANLDATAGDEDVSSPLTQRAAAAAASAESTSATTSAATTTPLAAGELEAATVTLAAGETPPQPPRAPFSAFRAALLRPTVAIFLVCGAVLSGGVSCVTNLLFLYMKDELGSSNILCGASVIVTVVFEIPIFKIASRVHKILKVNGLVVVAMGAYCVRGIGYSLVPRSMPYLILLLEPLHGVTYSTIKIAQVDFLKSNAPYGWEATMQSLSAATGGIGSMVGVVVGGMVLERYGATLLYRVAAGCVLLALCAFVAASALCKGKAMGHEKEGGEKAAVESDVQV